MTQVVLFTDRQKNNQSSELAESEVKNPLSTNINGSWEEFAGLSWLVIEDQYKYNFEPN